MRGNSLLATIVSLVLLSTPTSCGFDGHIWGGATASDFDEPPPVGTHTVTGRATALGAEATVTFWSPSGVALADQGTTTTEGGAFVTEFPADTDFINHVVTVSAGSSAVWGVLTQVPAKSVISDPSLSIDLANDISANEPVPYMDDLDVESTFATLLLLAKAHLSTPPSTIAALAPSAVVDSLNGIENLVAAADFRVMPLLEMVQRLYAADSGVSAAPLRPFPSEGESYLDVAALGATTDYDDDGTPDTDSAAFDEALANAVEALAFDVCYAPDKIKVVLMTDFSDTNKDLNCSTINRWKWTLDEAGKTMFFTGALHETTPNCDTDEPPCIDSAVFDAASQEMGNWTPNIVPMYDDGTNGDEVAGDNVWTITFELPWFDAGAPDARWVRIGYKYTWATQGALWTGSEEWPGNQRILELRDITGDRMIVRRDSYGDETTNKDKSNLLSPSRGGCGTVLWQSELNPPPEGRSELCANDTLERMYDSDDDCELDAWPSPGTSGPVTIPCTE